jgi:hypothetical protein
MEELELLVLTSEVGAANDEGNSNDGEGWSASGTEGVVAWLSPVACDFSEERLDEVADAGVLELDDASAADGCGVGIRRPSVETIPAERRAAKWDSEPAVGPIYGASTARVGDATAPGLSWLLSLRRVAEPPAGACLSIV